MCVHRVRLATAGLATQRGDTERERAWPNIDQAALLPSCQMARSALQFRARSARTCKIRTGKGERSEPAGKNHTAADPQVSSVHLRSALIRGAKTRPGGLDPHWHRQTAKKIGSYNRNSPVVHEGAPVIGTMLLRRFNDAFLRAGWEASPPDTAT